MNVDVYWIIAAITDYMYDGFGAMFSVRETGNARVQCDE
jgi:hypothetical protein